MRIFHSLKSPWLIFDFDGTLVNSRAAVEEAYRRVGSPMPAGAWGKPWAEWCTEEAHRAKTMLYPRLIKEYVTVRPTFTELFVPWQGTILTSASYRGLIAVWYELALGSPFPSIMGTSQSASGKINLLARAHKERPVIYFDDDMEFARRVRDEIGVTVIHVHDAGYTQLGSTIQENCSWTPSSLPPVVTSG